MTKYIFVTARIPFQERHCNVIAIISGNYEIINNETYLYIPDTRKSKVWLLLALSADKAKIGRIEHSYSYRAKIIMIL